MDSTSTRRPCFIEGDDGLAYLADNKEAGFSGKHYLFSRPICHSSSSSLRRNNTLRNLSFSSVYASSPRSVTARFYDGARYEQQHQPHFLDSCFLCNTPLGDNRDIFMYRGDTPFCSEECRQEQIEMDEANEKNWNLSSSMKSMRKKEHKKSNPPNPNKGYPFHTGAVAA